MGTRLFSRPNADQKSSIPLGNGSRVAVIGGGPAGAFFSYFLLDLADRAGLHLEVDIYEPRDFSLPAPQGCNMCAGVISETLIQNMAAEGFVLPASVVQKAISSYILHTELGSQRIDSALQEKRIGVIFRGAGPQGVRELKLQGFDGFLLSVAEQKGAHTLRLRVTGVYQVGGRYRLETRGGTSAGYDLLVITADINTNLVNLFEHGPSDYRPPKTAKTAIREYYLGRQIVENCFGDALHVFLLDIPGLDFAMLVPKGDYVSACLLGKDVDERLLETFLTAPEVMHLFPAGWRWDQPGCKCMPRINIRGAKKPYADRLVFIGDSGVSRLYKDGIGAAYRAAKSAAACAVFEGVSAQDFRRYYAPFCRATEADNGYGRLIYLAAHLLQRFRFSRKAVLHKVAAEQRASGQTRRLSSVLWDTFTGSAPYLDVFLRSLHPLFMVGFLGSLVNVLVNG